MDKLWRMFVELSLTNGYFQLVVFFIPKETTHVSAHVATVLSNILERIFLFLSIRLYNGTSKKLARKAYLSVRKISLAKLSDDALGLHRKLRRVLVVLISKLSF
jgi:hypothetical protein